MDKDFLDKKSTGMLHGVAILMMIYHHIFITGNTWYVTEGTSLFDFLNKFNFGIAPDFQMTFAYFCKMCVAIYAFTSGYAIYRQLERRNETNIFKMYLYSLKRIWSFYRQYLLCFIVFVTLSYYMYRGAYFDFSFENIILNLIGARATFNGTWWYVPVYFLMVMLAPLAYIILNNFKLKHYLACAALVVIAGVIFLVTGNSIVFIKGISTFLQNYVVIYVIIFMEGMFCGKYPIMEFIGKYLNVLLAVVLLLCAFVFRAKFIRAASDSVFDLALTLPLIISLNRIISALPKLKNALAYLGKYSAYMWYCHAYFYSYIFFIIVLKADMSLLVYLQVTLYSLACAIAFSAVEKLLFIRTKKSV